ncbi:hypothetical protein L211DRAFT_876730 [Terfezia boudieri ATCC MYA-4762]|uniref:Uncharacterized protein n=1 Tax=Terfezia boudieri ATCC MYA-4762 TaxID=1051890 RepID=A0A3N4LQ03_9PEZI|nr:hypothetical protein L211DRAFT_876730 [Terfezia boudieri ATCC MYA-4762]
MYYHLPAGVQLYGYPVEPENLTQLQSDLTEYNLDSYLPLEVIQWVQTALHKHNRHVLTTWNDEHEKTYDILWMEVINHCANNNSNLELSLLALNWAPVPAIDDIGSSVNLDLLKVEEEDWKDVCAPIHDPRDRVIRYLGSAITYICDVNDVCGFQAFTKHARAHCYMNV